MKEVLTYTSYQLQSGKWVPSVKVRQYLPTEIKEQTFTWEEQFDSKQAADDYAKGKAEEASKPN
jgi:hypothetical protein